MKSKTRVVIVIVSLLLYSAIIASFWQSAEIRAENYLFEIKANAFSDLQRLSNIQSLVDMVKHNKSFDAIMERTHYYQSYATDLSYEVRGIYEITKERKYFTLDIASGKLDAFLSTVYMISSDYPNKSISLLEENNRTLEEIGMLISNITGVTSSANTLDDISIEDINRFKSLTDQLKI